ncbi:hypothetical protein QL996_09710 [Planococcus sp. APC 4015]|nr:hypothetical protein [Planococcus sp. APC 4015]
MISRTRAGRASVVLLLAAALCGCSVDTLLWGADGGAVIAATDQLIEAAASGDAESLICPGTRPDLGSPDRWQRLSSEEPERFTGEYWPDQAALEPTWNINLSLPGDRAVDGEVFPGDVFYRGEQDSLCVADVVWSTVDVGD